MKVGDRVRVRWPVDAMGRRRGCGHHHSSDDVDGEVGQVVALHVRLGDHTVGVMLLTIASRGSPLIDSFSPDELVRA